MATNLYSLVIILQIPERLLINILCITWYAFINFTRHLTHY